MRPTDLDGKRIAVVMMSAIGDVVHALPVVNSIRAAAPRAHITWVIQPVPHELLREHPAVDEFVLFQRKAGWRAYPRLYRELRGRRFDLVLDLHVYFKAGVVTGMLRAPRKLGFDRARAPDLNWLFTTERIAPRRQGHVQDDFLEFLDHLGVPRRLEWRLEPTEGERARYAGLLPASDRPTVALVLGTSRADKDWPAERYVRLVDRLEEELGVRAILVGGRSEPENRVAEAIAARAARAPLDLREWDLRRLVYLLDRSDALVSPDTGPLHIGVALGVPSVALMGYTSPKRVGPYRFRELMVDAYGDPGEDYPVNTGYRPGRMERITVDAVMEKVRLALERERPAR